MIKNNIFRIVLINLLVFFVIISSIIIFPPLLADGYKVLRNNILTNITILDHPRCKLPNYKDADWCKYHFAELKKLSSEYYDYIGWRRNEFKGRTININKAGYRNNSKENKITDYIKNEVWFFGGSTLWGTGVKDDQTIPAIFEKLSNMPSSNFGESGYTTQQNLNLLIKNYLMGGKPKIVFFYDGVNDIINKCRKELSFFSTGRENYIKDQLSKSNFSKLIDPAKQFFKIILNKFNSKSNAFYDCDTNQIKSDRIANNFVMNWEIAKNIVENNGGSFYPIFQPVSSVGEPNTNHLELNYDIISGGITKQYLIMYKKIQKKLSEKNFSYFDLTNIFNNKEYYYIDFEHVSPNGNKKIAKSIFNKIK